MTGKVVRPEGQRDPLTGFALFGGPETKYDPKYCQMLIDHAEQTGQDCSGSFRSFAVKIGVLPDTLDDWAKKFAAFGKAKQIAKAIQEEKMSIVGMKGMQGRLTSFHQAGWIFWMKARFGWNDQGPQDQEDADLEFED